jgi:hypothetical protein
MIALEHENASYYYYLIIMIAIVLVSVTALGTFSFAVRTNSTMVYVLSTGDASRVGEFRFKTTIEFS